MIVNYVIVVVLISLSALFSGLTLGLLGLDKIGLKIVIGGENKRLAENAAKIAPIRENGNLLLCTLLLGNVAVNSYLSILLSTLTSGLVGFFVSTFLILIFGEIIPQATCSRYALQIGSAAVPLVRILIVIMYPITLPLSKILDYMLGHEVGTIHSRKELTELLEIHVQHGAMDVETGQISQGAITYQDKAVRDVMTPIDHAYFLSANDVLDFKKITEIFRSGFSRIPVYGKDKFDIIGVLLVKDLIFVDPDDATPVRNFIQIFGRRFHVLWPDDRLGEVLKIFKKGKSHLAIVRDVNNEGDGDPFYELKGILTLEDILEEILGDEIQDEYDSSARENKENNGEEDKDGESGFDYSKLRLLDSGKLEYEQLTKEEALAIGAHFIRNVQPFSTFAASSWSANPSTVPSDSSPATPQTVANSSSSSSSSNNGLNTSTTNSSLTPSSPVDASDEMIRCLLTGCPVIDRKRLATEGSEPSHDDFLYRSGEETDFMVMVLTGKLVVLAGEDKFRAEAGPWSVIGAEALKRSSYTPDFSAYVGSDHLRFIEITKKQFEMAMSCRPIWKVENKVKGVVFKEQEDNISPFKTSASSKGMGNTRYIQFESPLLRGSGDSDSSNKDKDGNEIMIGASSERYEPVRMAEVEEARTNVNCGKSQSFS